MVGYLCKTSGQKWKISLNKKLSCSSVIKYRCHNLMSWICSFAHHCGFEKWPEIIFNWLVTSHWICWIYSVVCRRFQENICYSVEFKNTTYIVRISVETAKQIWVCAPDRNTTIYFNSDESIFIEFNWIICIPSNGFTRANWERSCELWTWNLTVCIKVTH